MLRAIVSLLILGMSGQGYLIPHSPRGGACSLADVSGLVVNLQGDLGITSDVNGISNWADQENSNDFAQAITVRRPQVVSAGLNGKDTVHFVADGANGDYLNGPDLSSAMATEGEVFVVFKVDNDPPGTAPYAGPAFQWNAGGGLNSHQPWTDGNFYDRNLTTVRKTPFNPSPSFTTFRLYNVSSESGGWTARVDTTQVFTTGTNTYEAPSATQLGRTTTINGDPRLDGEIAMLAAYDSVLSSGDRSTVEDCIDELWALTGY